MIKKQINNQKSHPANWMAFIFRKMAGATGLEPAASGVTGRRYNQLNYTPNRETEYKDLIFFCLAEISVFA